MEHQSLSEGSFKALKLLSKRAFESSFGENMKFQDESSKFTCLKFVMKMTWIGRDW